MTQEGAEMLFATAGRRFVWLELDGQHCGGQQNGLLK